MKVKCETCRYGLYNDELDMIECRYGPPTVIFGKCEGEKTCDRAWPMMLDDEWCHRWKRILGEPENKADREDKSLWPDPIVTPQEMVEAAIEGIEVNILNREKPDALKEMKKLLGIFKDLNIGGRVKE